MNRPAPTTDAEWARSVEQRLADVQKRGAAWVGGWLLSTNDNGRIQATNPSTGGVLSLDPADVDEAPDDSPVRGFVTKAQMAAGDAAAKHDALSELWGALTGQTVGDDDSLIGKVLQGQVDGLPDAVTVLNQIRDILGGQLVTPINSAVQAVKDWFTGLTKKTQALDPATGTLDAGALVGIITAPVKQATDIANTLVTAVNKAGGDLQDFLTGFLTLSQKADSALASVTTAQTAAAANDQKNVPLGGLIKTILGFVGLDGSAPLATDLSVVGPSLGDLVVRANNFLGINASNPPGIYFGKVNYLYGTENQAIEFALGDNGQWNGAATYGLFHCNPEGTLGSYIKAVNDAITLGSFTRSGATWTFTPFSGGQFPVPLKGGNLVRVRNTDTTYTPDVNRNPLGSVANASVPFGASRRSAFVALERAFSAGFFGFGAQNYDSYRIGGIIASDFIPVSIVGSGAELVRTNPQKFTLATQQTIPFPNGFWQAVRFASTDFPVLVSQGRIYSTKSRFVTINVRVESTSGFNAALTLRLFRGSGSDDPVADKKIGSRIQPGDNGYIYAYEGTVTVYMQANEYVCLGYFSSGGGFQSAGDINATADGFSVYMTVLGAGGQ